MITRTASLRPCRRLVSIAGWACLAFLFAPSLQAAPQPFRPAGSQATSRPASPATTEPQVLPTRLRAVVIDNSARARSLHQSQERVDPVRYALPNLSIKVHTYDLDGNVDVVESRTDARGVVDVDLGDRRTGTSLHVFAEDASKTIQYLSLPMKITAEMTSLIYCFEITQNPGVLKQQVSMIVTDNDAVDEATGIGSVQVRQIVQIENSGFEVYVGPGEDPAFSFQIPATADVTGLTVNDQVIPDTRRRDFRTLSSGVPIERPIYPTFTQQDATRIMGTYNVPVGRDEEAQLWYHADVPVEQLTFGVEVGIVHYVPENQEGFQLALGQRFGREQGMAKEVQLYFGGNLRRGTTVPLEITYGSPPLRPLDPVTLLVTAILSGGLLLACLFGALVSRARRRSQADDAEVQLAQLDRKFAEGSIDAATYRHDRARLLGRSGTEVR